MKKLTPKQKKFIAEYLIDLNATGAALRAGYSKKTATAMGHENLRKPNIEYHIQLAMKKQQLRTQVTADRVIAEFAKIAFVKECDFYDNNGNVKRLSELDDTQKAALQSYTIKTISLGDGEYEEVPVFKIHDKIKGLENLGKHLGIFEKDNTQSNKIVVTKNLDDFYNE